jgi:hypothetical protein
MRGMKRFRFSLRLLFVVATATTLFLGYSQLRRRSIIQAFQPFEDIGAYVDIPCSYTDYLWQRYPRVARVRLNALNGKPREFLNRDLDAEYRRLKHAGIEKFYWITSSGDGLHEGIPFDNTLEFQAYWISDEREVRSVGHHRMPVLLTSEAEYAAWLNPEIVERGPLEALMRPLADGVLECYPAGGDH